MPADEIVTRGIALSPEGRRCFSRMTVRENLDLGAYRRRGPGHRRRHGAGVHAVPPAEGAGEPEGGHDVRRRAADARHRPGADGQPRLLLLDEPSLGIAPILVDRIYQTIGEIHRSGVAILLVEQNANRALDAAGARLRARDGPGRARGPTAVTARDPRVREAYLRNMRPRTTGRSACSRCTCCSPGWSPRRPAPGSPSGRATASAGPDARPGPVGGRPHPCAGAARQARLEVEAGRPLPSPPPGHRKLQKLNCQDFDDVGVARRVVVTGLAGGATAEV